MCLYGHEIDDTTTVWEANLGWICKLDKGDFLGRDALIAQKQSGVKRRLVGFEMEDRLIARDGYEVMVAGTQAGQVTSGSPAPFLKKNIGMAYVPVESSAAGHEESKSPFAPAASRRGSFPCRSTNAARLSQSAARIPCIPATCATPKNTSGFACRATSPPSASPTTRSTSSATSCYVELPKVGAKLVAGQDLRHRRIGESRQRNLLARLRRSHRGELSPQPTRRKPSTRIRTARPG